MLVCMAFAAPKGCPPKGAAKLVILSIPAKFFSKMPHSPVSNIHTPLPASLHPTQTDRYSPSPNSSLKIFHKTQEISSFHSFSAFSSSSYCSRVAQTATDFADASHSKSAKSVTTTVSYGIFSSENAYPCTATPFLTFYFIAYQHLITSTVSSAVFTSSSIFSARFSSDLWITLIFGLVTGCFATKIVQQSS